MMGLGKGNPLKKWQFLVSMLDFSGVARMICGLIFDLSAQFTDAQGEWRSFSSSLALRFTGFSSVSLIQKTGEEGDSHHEL